jgi:hypothetical protein
MLVIALAKHHTADSERERGLVTRLIELPSLIDKTLALDESSRTLRSASRTNITRFSSAVVRSIRSRWKAR